MLIRLGFDLTGLVAGGATAKAEIASIAAAANAAQAAVVRFNAQGRPMNALGQFMSTQPWKQMAAASASGATTVVAAMSKIEAAADRLNISMGGLKLVAGTIALLGFVQFVHGAVSAATTFQSEMLLIQTQARATANEVQTMTDAVMGMAVGVQTGPEALAKGLYHIESVGLRGAKALDVLTTAAKGARLGNADLESVTNALVAAVTSGIKGVENMSEAMGTLDGIVGSGNMRMQDLSDSLRSGVLATATAFGLSLQDVGAALASMTDQGIPATEAATRLRITMALLGAPTAAATAQLSRIGLTSTDMAYAMRSPGGLIAAIELLRDHLRGSGLDAVQQSQILKAAFGGSRSSSGLLTLIGNVDLLHAKMDIIKGASKNFLQLFEVQSQTAAAKFNALGAAVEVTAVHFGNALLPTITLVAQIMGALAQQTALVVPILLLITAAVVRLGVVALVRLISSLGLTTAAMIMGRFASALLAGGLSTLAATGTVASLSIRSVGMAALSAIGPLNILMIAIAAITIAYTHAKEEADKAAAAFDQRIKDVSSKSNLEDLQKQKANLQAALKQTLRTESFVAGPLGLSAAPAIRQGIATIDAAIADLKTKIKTGFVTAKGIVIDETSSLVDQLGSSLSSVMDAVGGGLGADMMSKFAKEIQDHVDEPVKAFDALVAAEKTALTPAQEIARLYGMLSSQAMADGLKSGIASVRAAAEAAKQSAEQALFERGVNVKTGTGAQVLESYRVAAQRAAAVARTLTGTVRALGDAMQDGSKSASVAAQEFLDKFGGSLTRLKQIAGVAGGDLMTAIADGIESQRNKPLNALKALHTALANEQTKHAQIAFLLAALAGAETARGLASADPLVYARAVAAVKIMTDQLDRLTNGAYSAGLNAGENWAKGVHAGMSKYGIGNRNFDRAEGSGGPKGNTWGTGGLKPPEINAGTKAYNEFIKSLNKTPAAAKAAGASLQSMANMFDTAMAKIKSSAMKYFDEVHKRHLQAIQDKKDLMQAAIDQAQTGLNAADAAMQLQDLLRAVQEATDPQSQLAALQALHRFQAQQQIDAAQKAADKQTKIAEDAENLRYTKQIAAFNKALNALITFLDHHPKLWRSAQHRVIALLHSFGISYQSAGALLGNSFAKGFVSALHNLEKAMAGALKIKISWATLVLGGKGFAEGAWQLANDQFAQVHKDEMIVPATAAGPFRAWLSRAGNIGGGGTSGFGSMASDRLAGRGADTRGGGTLIFKVGDETLAELTDRRLFVANGIRQPTEMQIVGSAR